jgi:hypothetical protein
LRQFYCAAVACFLITSAVFVVLNVALAVFGRAGLAGLENLPFLIRLPMGILGVFGAFGAIALWMGMIWDCLFMSKLTVLPKIGWFLLMVFINVPGALIYYFAHYQNLSVNEVKSKLVKLWLIQAANILSIPLFGLVAESRGPGSSDWSVSHWLMAGLAIYAALGGFFLRRRLIRRSEETLAKDPSDPKALKQWEAGHLIAIMMAEGIVVWGVAVRMVIGGTLGQAAPFYATGFLLLMAMDTPHAEHSFFWLNACHPATSCCQLLKPGVYTH